MFLVLIFFALVLLPAEALAEGVPNTHHFIVEASSLADLAPGGPTELVSFYAQREYRSAWDFGDDKAQQKTIAFINSLEALIAYHGLERESYHLDSLRALVTSKEANDQQKLEVQTTESLLHLAHDLHGDSVNLESLYTGWNFHRQAADMPTLLNAALTSSTMDTFFNNLAPQNKEYRMLAQALQAYSAIAAKGGWPTLPLGASLKPQDRDPRVAQLRARLQAEGYVTSPHAGLENLFDDELNKVLIEYQVRNGLLPDGHAGTQTQEALNVPVAARLVQIRANMERWRHMPENFPPDRYTQVNIPDFTITIVENGGEVYRGLVVDGRVDRQTPFINSKIVNMVINPSWHVPAKLARKDILPKLRHDPRYLEKLGFVIVGRDEDPAGTRIDWTQVSPQHFNYQLRQVPGDLNSLGQLKFNFDNPFSVYMHGTPHQELFEKARRNFSSGCVRLEDPMRVGEILLEHNHDKDGEWTQQRIQDGIDAEKTHFITLAKPMPIFFVYWSVFAGDDGQINFRKDIYGYDAQLIDKLKPAAEVPTSNE